MKICCLIDSLNSGGAQRQMTWLIRALTGNGHQVRLLTYHHYDHYLPLVQKCGVEPEIVSSSAKVGRFWAFRTAVRRETPDVIISFLDTPNFLGLFAAMAPGGIPLIVSERNHDIGGKTRATSIRFNAFRAATKVVTNCYSQNDFVAKNYPFLKQKLTTILNCVDLNKFTQKKSPTRDSGRKLIVAASVIARKNAKNLILGLQIANQQGSNVELDWFGNNLFENGKPTAGSQYFLECEKMVQDMGLEKQFRFPGRVSDLYERYRDFDGCCLPSFREGCPNVICEAMSSGLPVLVSDHGDMKRMVEDQRGFRFDPNDPESIANAIISYSSAPSRQLDEMGSQNRVWAEENLSPERFAYEYESLIQEVAS